MRKIIYTILFLFISSPFSFAQPIEGGVSFTVNSARQYLQEGQTNNIDITGPFQFEMKNTQKVVYSYNLSHQVIGITVQYVNEPNMAYIYGPNNSLIYVDKYDKSTDIYPHRGYRYDLSGKLNLTSLTVSKNEMFRFSPEGKLIAHSVNGIIYDENGKVIGVAR